MWIFIAMFALPEILFLFTLSAFDFFGINIVPLSSILFGRQFFSDHPIYLLLAHILEWLGALGLLVLSIKFNKKIFVILFSIILLWLSVYLYFGYVISTMNLVF